MPKDAGDYKRKLRGTGTVGRGKSVGGALRDALSQPVKLPKMPTHPGLKMPKVQNPMPKSMQSGFAGLGNAGRGIVENAKTTLDLFRKKK